MPDDVRTPREIGMEGALNLERLFHAETTLELWRERYAHAATQIDRWEREVKERRARPRGDLQEVPNHG